MWHSILRINVAIKQLLMYVLSDLLSRRQKPENRNGIKIEKKNIKKFLHPSNAK